MWFVKELLRAVRSKTVKECQDEKPPSNTARAACAATFEYLQPEAFRHTDWIKASDGFVLDNPYRDIGAFIQELVSLKQYVLADQQPVFSNENIVSGGKPLADFIGIVNGAYVAPAGYLERYKTIGVSLCEMVRASDVIGSRGVTRVHYHARLLQPTFNRMLELNQALLKVTAAL